jgi:hypothetical protein
MPVKASLETALALGKIAPVTGDIAGREFGDLGFHRGVVTVDAELAAIVETDRVEGIERDQRDIVGELAAAQRPQFLEDEGRGDDGRSGIEGETVLAELRRPAAGLFKLFENGDTVSARAEPDGGGKAAETGSDHDGVGPACRRPGRQASSGSWTVIMAVCPSGLRDCVRRQHIISCHRSSCRLGGG